MPVVSIGSHCKVNTSEIVRAFSCSGHLATDLSPRHISRLGCHIIESAHGIGVISETEAFNDDIIASAISWSTLWECSSDRVESECEVVVVIIHSVERHLHLYCDTLTPTSG